MIARLQLPPRRIILSEAINTIDLRVGYRF
jgi:hypothetical protein